VKKGKIRFVPSLYLRGNQRVRVSLTGYRRVEDVVDAMLEAEKQARQAGLIIRWIYKLRREAHGIIAWRAKS
jgi:hypothetical protein